MGTSQTGLPILVVNICPSVFLVMLACQKQVSGLKLSQDDDKHTSAIFLLRTINSIGCILLPFQADDETTCLDLHTCFMVADLAGTASACCSMDSFLRLRCSLLFWVWDKPKGHHLGCKYWLSCFMSFSPSLLQSGLLLTRLLLATISLWETP